tara:strand:+ start:476 stop:2128 length:1653 start_codon:yes stop_codon:yes gene_type:complete
MAFVVNDRVKETTTSTGTGTINLGGAETGFETFVAGIGNSNTTYYCIQAQGGSAFEIGVGTVTDASPDTLSRTTIISSSNGDAAVDFGAGSKDVFCTLPASKAVIEDNSTNADIAGNLTIGGTVDGVDIAARDAVLTSTTTTATNANTTANAALPKAGGTMTGGIDFNDSIKARFGTGNDLEIFHDSADSIINNSTGTLKIQADTVRFQNAAGTETIFGGTADSSAFLVFDDATKIATSSSGVSVTGDIAVTGTVDGVDIATRDGVLTSTTTTANAALPKAGGVMTGDLQLNDNVKIEIGGGQDLKLYHDTSDSYISEEGTGKLIIRGSTAVRITNVGGDNMFVGNDGGAAEMYHAGTKKAETTSSGLTVTGTLSATTLSGAISGNISQLTNNSGYVTSSGVTSVATGNGLSGGTITSTGTLTMSGSYSGSFSASSNITAYSSDERLKDFKGKIDNALDKVDELNGYYFEWNDIAKGLDGGKSFKEGMEVGVSAQEIEKVLPEVVTEAPIVKIENLDVDYKTVYYDKIVPLLIEAIKELRAEVKELKKAK